MIAWLLSPAAGAGEVEFELLGPWLLCIASRMPIERHFGLLDWAPTMRGHLPDVLASMYPIR